MRVFLTQGLEGARQAKGLAVVIDVFRAFTTACFVHASGGEILAVAAEDPARALAGTLPGSLLMGERDCVPLPGFDFGNSPALVEGRDLSGRTVVFTTSAGTQGLAEASGAEEIVTGSFVNARAVVEHIRARDPETVTLVALGESGLWPSPEDTMCAIYIKNELEGFPNSFETLARYLRDVPSAAKFLDPDKDYAPARDLDLCLDLDRFGFVLAAVPGPGGSLLLQPRPPGAPA